MRGNTYSFDDCSILNTCEVEIPKAYRIFVGKDRLKSKDFFELSSLINKLDSLKITKFRFVPSTIKDNIVRVANKLIEDEGINIHMFRNLARPFKAGVIDQLEQFGENIKDNFGTIEKKEDTDSIKTVFTGNEMELKKERNIPEDDDFKIIAGYINHGCEGKKYLITQDEHFWGYTDLIQIKFGIVIIEEWNCHKLVS